MLLLGQSGKVQLGPYALVGGLVSSKVGIVGQLGLLQSWFLAGVGTVQLGHLHPYCTGV